jgi:outer membrane lipase/esterase
MNGFTKFGAVSSVLLALLAGCGGGNDNAGITSVVSFGDSLSDVGTYKVGTVAALNGGKFTVNGTGGNVWTEFLAADLNTPAQCAARTGLLPNVAGVTGAPVQDFANCFNYAQGSSRVTSNGTGPNGVALQQYGQKNLGYMADSLNEQFNRHLAKVGGAYSGRELVTVNAGGNDLFMQLNGLGSAAAGGAAAAAAGTIAGWSQNAIATVTLGGSAATNAAATAAVTAMGQAGTELAGYIKTLVVGKGARYVLVRTLGDVNVTPFGRSLDAGTRSLITAMTQAFDGQLKTGLDGTSGVIILDDYALTTDVAANPGKYGYTNITMQSCGPNAFNSSIVCNTGNLIAGDTSHYAFADSVHPTPYSHQKEAESAVALLNAAGWH